MKNPGGMATAASESDSRLLAGQLVGDKYRVSHLLGEGGMASVWAGSNERTGKRIALKVIRRSFMATPGADVFLQTEGLAASRVNHPNVVTVFDVIEHEGMACIVMELLDGVPLGTYIARNKPLSLRDAVGILMPAMRGVAAAHAQGVVHRDLKPQNVFVCVDNDGRVVTTKVLDFGVSMMMDWARGQSVAAVPGLLIGTPSYMAPEHIQGATDLDPRTDVYGFGVLLYETLSGTPAFPGSNDIQEVLHRVLNESAVPLRELRSDLPMGITSIVETAIAKRPEERFESLNQMMAAIEEEVALLPPLATGSTAAPVSMMNYSVSGPVSVGIPLIVERESSEQYATQTYGLSRRDSDRAVPLAKMIEEPSRRLRAPMKTPVVSMPSFPSEAASVDFSPKQAPTVLIARSLLFRNWLDFQQWLREHRRGLGYLVVVGAVLIGAFSAWLLAGTAQRSRPVTANPKAPTPVSKPAVTPPPPTLPAPIGEGIGSLPVEGLPSFPPLESIPAAPRASKPSRVHAAGDKGFVASREGAEAQAEPDGGGKSRAVTEDNDRGVPAVEDRNQVPPSVETSPQVAPATEPNSQVTRRAGALKVDDF